MKTETTGEFLKTKGVCTLSIVDRRNEDNQFIKTVKISDLLEEYASQGTKGEVVQKAIEYVIDSRVEDGKGLPAMLMGDVSELIEILTGKKIDWRDFIN